MKLYFALSFLILVFNNICSAQIRPGARQVALSHSDVAMSDDVFSLFNNPAGAAQLNWREVGVYYSPAPFGIKELANGYAAYQQPVGIGTFAAGFMTYGFDLYRENKFALAFSMRAADNFFIGTTVTYQSLTIEKYGSDGSISINIGGLTYLLKTLRLGFSVSNINRASYGKEKNQIPTILSAGVSYDYSDNLTINTSVIKELDFHASMRFGIEYSIIKYLDLRIGLSNKPNSFSSGIGINYDFIQLDYALFTHQDLGLTHQAGIIIHFGSGKSRKEKIKDYLNFD